MSSLKILIVDDDNHVLETIAELLGSSGFDVISATSAESAMEILKGIKVCAVLTDFIMPGMNGLDFAEKVAKNQPKIPIVVYTGADIEDFKSVFSNVHSVLRKPAHPETLIEALKKAISEYKSDNIKLQSSLQKLNRGNY